ncbi:hypothetical protein ACFQ7N_10340 [Streptomyces niveus]|uniref:hypothetical protein n=1 Tax=Streptomyces niveus TaxID=193462 RepID=UPI0036CBF0D1
MDADNALARAYDTNPARRAAAPPYALHLRWLRRHNNAQWHDTRITLPEPVRSRPPRYIVYARNSAGSGTADETLSIVRRHVERAGGVIAREVTDAHAPCHPQKRPGWAEARRLVGRGFADGIAVVDRDTVSHHDPEYEAEIIAIGATPALVLLVRPESAT